ncbi:MAG TPA: single-stranded-DNA-specific exonuclease RecJ [Candidatus Limnocylindrales bacterium]|nr:single-stranded-DNA-specific exonuclease RecJ [Candidatus Limnocylindrales bacterium]
MIGPRVEWHLPEPLLDPPTFAGFDRPVATLLARRGFRDDAQLTAFLEAGMGSLHDASLMADADVALARLERALDHGERVAIWGDYDADGMTAVVVWSIALRALGAEAVRHVPSRLAEGYGLSNEGLDRLAAAGVTLVVTCDCGVVNAAEVEHATSIGLDVIITDHHLPSGDLPRAVAVVDPHRPDCSYPDSDLTGAGLSYKLASALLARRGGVAPDLAGIAAIGTIADLAPMTGESRAIVRLGLADLATTQRAGLRALLSRACEHPEQPTARDLAFGIAPRINSAGRIAEAEMAISLLLAEEPEDAERIADELEGVHHTRRALTATAVEQAMAMTPGLAGDGPIALHHDAWAPGIVGLIAGRLAESLGRPVAVAGPIGDELRGSVRAPIDFHAAAALEACAALLLKRGGHAGAGGFSVAATEWHAFAAAFAQLPRPFPPDPVQVLEPAGRLAIDLVLPAAHLGWSLADQITRLAPFGPGHVEPILAVTGLRVGEARRVGADGRHLALRMLRGAETFDAIAFGTPADRPLPEEGSRLDLVGTLERDTFQGAARLRLRALDYATADASPLAARRLAADDGARVAIPVTAPVGAG